jgi:hypothetical protein
MGKNARMSRSVFFLLWIAVTLFNVVLTHVYLFSRVNVTKKGTLILYSIVLTSSLLWGGYGSGHQFLSMLAAIYLAILAIFSKTIFRNIRQKDQQEKKGKNKGRW